MGERFVIVSLTRSEDGEFLLIAAFKVTASSGEPGKKELLGQIGADGFRSPNRKVAEHEPNTPIGLGVVQV